MGVKIKCPKCSQFQEVSDEYIGKKIQCNGCKNEFIAELPQQKNLLKQKPHLVVSLFAAVMLFAAIWDMPYDYYKLLRIVVCVAAVIVAFVGYKKKQLWIANIFAVVALIFNPVVPVELAKELWRPIDIICGILFGIVAVPWKLRWFVCVVLVGMACYAGFFVNTLVVQRQAERQAEQRRIKLKMLAEQEAEQKQIKLKMLAEQKAEQERAYQAWQEQNRKTLAEQEAEQERVRQAQNRKILAEQEAEKRRKEQELQAAVRYAEEKWREEEQRQMDIWNEATKRLAIGMSKVQVRSICGEPKRTSIIYGREWWYYNYGHVYFKGDKLSGW